MLAALDSLDISTEHTMTSNPHSQSSRVILKELFIPDSSPLSMIPLIERGYEYIAGLAARAQLVQAVDLTDKTASHGFHVPCLVGKPVRYDLASAIEHCDADTTLQSRRMDVHYVRAIGQILTMIPIGSLLPPISSIPQTCTSISEICTVVLLTWGIPRSRAAQSCACAGSRGPTFLRCIGGRERGGISFILAGKDVGSASLGRGVGGGAGLASTDREVIVVPAESPDDDEGDTDRDILSCGQ